MKISRLSKSFVRSEAIRSEGRSPNSQGHYIAQGEARAINIFYPCNRHSQGEQSSQQGFDYELQAQFLFEQVRQAGLQIT